MLYIILFVFNYIDQIYGVARDVQFKDNIDCFYNDDKIDEFLECVIKRLNYDKERIM